MQLRGLQPRQSSNTRWGSHFEATPDEKKHELTELCHALEKQTVTPKENLQYAQQRLRDLKIDANDIIEYFSLDETASTNSA